MEVIGDRFLYESQIGEGCWSIVVKANDMHTNTHVAVKLEVLTKPENSLLLREAKIFKVLAGLQGVPKLYDQGCTSTHSYMAIELLEANLEELYLAKQLTSLDVMSRANELLVTFQQVHMRRIVHQDVKPTNIMAKGSSTYLVDFGLASQIKPVRKNTQRFREILGSPSFASLSGLLGVTQFPKDDLEALGYCIVWLIRGRLPWEDCVAEADLSGLKTMKFHATVRQICKDCPDEMMHYFNYIKGLRDLDQPDYEFLRGLVVSAHNKLIFNKLPATPVIEKRQQPRQRMKSDDMPITTPVLSAAQTVQAYHRSFHGGTHLPGHAKALNLIAMEKDQSSNSISSIEDLQRDQDCCSPKTPGFPPFSGLPRNPGAEFEPSIEEPHLSPIVNKLEEARRASKRLETILELKGLRNHLPCESHADESVSSSSMLSSGEANKTDRVEEKPKFSPESRKQLKRMKQSLDPVKEGWCEVF
jgi:serine/threonine protein kinase